MHQLKRIGIGFGILFLIASCKTYTISLNSFQKQLISATRENSKQVEINNPLFYKNITYSTNNISQLKVLEKKGVTSYLTISPAIEMKVTHRNGQKYHFYFDTVLLENGMLKGGRSRFVQKISRSIPMDSIVKIEVQDGGKKFKYKK